MSSRTHTLQDVASVDDFLNVAATETAPLFEYLEFDFLLEYDVFAPSGGEVRGQYDWPDYTIGARQLVLARVSF